MRPRDTAQGAGRQVRVLIVDDHEVVREGLSAVLGADDRFDVVAAVPTAASAVRQTDRSRPDVALIDLRLPDAPGIGLCHELHDRFPRMALVMLSSYASEDTVRDAMEAGVYAYLTKETSLAELRTVLAEAVASTTRHDDRRIVSQLRELVARRPADGHLTRQQERVLELCADGMTYREIGLRLFISESTVRFHMQKLKAKFGARTKSDLIARAMRAGAMEPATEGVALSM